MTDFLTRLCLICAAVLFAAWLVLQYRGCLAQATDALAKVSRARLAAFLFFVAVATVCAQKPGGTNEPPQGAGSPLHLLHFYTANPPGPLFRLESESTNGTYSYAMPTNGARCENWWIRGAYEDVFRLDLDGMLFPLGTNLCDSLWAYTWGMVGARLDDASNRLVAAGVPMSAVPQLSQFWSAETDGGGRLLTWQDFALDRDTNTPVSAQLELMPSGDFIARSNEVERVYRRVNPDDWDDDGIPNDYDIQPLAYDGDNFGPHQQLPEGANSNAYCWVDLVVPDANAIVTFAGDGYSALPDPTFVAKAGATNRVILLIGKTYHVASRLPIACIGQSSAEIEVSQPSATELSICWPVTIEPVAMRGGSSFTMFVWPDCLCGGFTWTNGCCAVNSLGGGVFSYACSDACHCGGCCATGYYGYESYRLPAYGGWCGCNGEYDPRPEEGDDDGPYDAGASATFSKSAVIFEDRYENTPGVWVERQSSQTELHCVAHGGPNGGHVRFEIAGENKLERVSGHLLPVEQDVSPGKKLDFTIAYQGQLPSTSAEDIVVTTTFAENAAGATPVSSQAKLTSVKVELEAIYVASENTNQNRHVYGVGEKIRCRHQPTSACATWVVTSHETENEMVDGSGCDKEITFAHLAAYAPVVKIESGDAEYLPQFVLKEPTDVIAYTAFWNGMCLPRNRAGGFGMKIRTYVYPMDVSFQGIDMVEVPCTDVVQPSGYYATTNFDGFLSHSIEAGAGRWSHVKAGNYWMEDEAVSGERLAPWSSGMLVWNVPIAWNYRYDSPSSSWPTGHYASTCKKIGTDSSFQQIYSINYVGSVTIEKHDHVSTRSTNDVITVDYVIEHEGNH